MCRTVFPRDRVRLVLVLGIDIAPEAHQGRRIFSVPWQYRVHQSTSCSRKNASDERSADMLSLEAYILKRVVVLGVGRTSARRWYCDKIGPEYVVYNPDGMKGLKEYGNRRRWSWRQREVVIRDAVIRYVDSGTIIGTNISICRMRSNTFAWDIR